MKMKTRLCFHGGRVRRLTWTAEHSASSSGPGVMLFSSSSEILDGATFVDLAGAGAWIESTDPDKVSRALGLDPNSYAAKQIKHYEGR